MKKSHLIYMIVAIVLVIVIPIGLMLWNQAHPSQSVHEAIMEERYKDLYVAPKISLEELEPLYEVEPYHQLLPRTTPQGFTLETAWREKKRDPDHIFYKASDSVQRLTLKYVQEDGSVLTVSVDEFLNQRIADPLRPETYSLKIYYEEPHEDNNYYYSFSDPGFFYSEGITLETVAARIYSGEKLNQEYACYAAIGVVLDYPVCVYYQYEGSNITPEDLYEMITSAKYFET